MTLAKGLNSKFTLLARPFDERSDIVANNLRNFECLLRWQEKRKDNEDAKIGPVVAKLIQF